MLISTRRQRDGIADPGLLQPHAHKVGAAAASGDVVALLETAIRLEKDSVLFYNELLGEVDENDAPAVQEIIDEEKRHVRTLVEARKRHKS